MLRRLYSGKDTGSVYSLPFSQAVMKQRDVTVEDAKGNLKVVGGFTKSGVFKYEDFLDQIIIDRYDTGLDDFYGTKNEQVRSIHSEDVVTWNSFRTLMQLNPQIWVADLFRRSFGQHADIADRRSVRVSLWRWVSPPPELPWAEGSSQIDIVIEWPGNVWYIESKYQSDISMAVSNNPERDQIWRSIDVGSYAEQSQQFHFSLLYWSAEKSAKGLEMVNKYADRVRLVSKSMDYRPDGLVNWKNTGELIWSDIGHCLSDYQTYALNAHEKRFVASLQEWASQRGIWS